MSSTLTHRSNARSKITFCINKENRPPHHGCNIDTRVPRYMKQDSCTDRMIMCFKCILKFTGKHNLKQHIGTQEQYEKLDHILRQQEEQTSPPRLHRHSRSHCRGSDPGWKQGYKDGIDYITTIGYHNQRYFSSPSRCPEVFNSAPLSLVNS